ncbi:hypothetical protein ACRQ5D_22375 [Mucilaginibacter sp. P25]|uniref:Uncharacterized protein n=1 Tax=Mucilaginibacter gossypii TaxID=551996 RepID=A0A1G7ZUR8_9SPHI|nr:hypothetical protein [Mucilaginibacter gossypii]SDH12403.1 hypothetical protein SAMN05192573_1072 [Mucilaginibacter gossypii]
MLQLISKLQHNTYKKGEYSDEEYRNLDDTIQLIKDFPWDAERALTDIQLTGPSVTIQDNDLNYLKLGLYFNSKFCVYYLDIDNHLYEYHAPNVEEACNLVKDFFGQALEQHIMTYYKTDIEEIIHKQSRNTADVEIRFKNGEVIKPTMLISDADLLQKFPEKSGVKITFIVKTRFFGESKSNFNRI